HIGNVVVDQILGDQIGTLHTRHGLLTCNARDAGRKGGRRNCDNARASLTISVMSRQRGRYRATFAGGSHANSATKRKVNPAPGFGVRVGSDRGATSPYAFQLSGVFKTPLIRTGERAATIVTTTMDRPPRLTICRAMWINRQTSRVSVPL